MAAFGSGTANGLYINRLSVELLASSSTSLDRKLDLVSVVFFGSITKKSTMVLPRVNLMIVTIGFPGNRSAVLNLPSICVLNLMVALFIMCNK